MSRFARACRVVVAYSPAPAARHRLTYMGRRRRMRKGQSALAIASSQPAAELAVWTIDPIHSSATIGVRHLTVSTWTARLGSLSGTLHFDETTPETASVEASIDVTALRTGLDIFDMHLHS